MVMESIKAIDSFPVARKDYLADKTKYKLGLGPKMKELKELFTGTNPVFIHSNKTIFFQEAIFHSSEVDSLTIKEGGVFHIFDSREVIDVVDASTVVVNSKAAQQDQTDDQKVVFKLSDENNTIGEIEMRNDSDAHYRQVKFWMDREKMLSLLREKIGPMKEKSENIIVYGKAVTRFKL